MSSRSSLSVVQWWKAVWQNQQIVDEKICGTDMYLVWRKRLREWQMVTVMRWYAQDEVNQEESEQNEVDGMKKGADSTGKAMHI